jgi:hypothetical protein
VGNLIFSTILCVSDGMGPNRVFQEYTYSIWDADVVEVQGTDAGVAANDIERAISPAQRRTWAAGTAAQWANEAHAIARDQIYPPLMNRRQLRLPRDYAWRQANTARLQLAKAGVRLAWLLNSTLK